MDFWKHRHFIGRREEDNYIILDGPRGAGKSSLMNPIVHWARMERWLVIYIPSAYAHMYVGEQMTRSRIDNTCVEQLKAAARFCDSLIKIDGERYKTLPLRTEFYIGGEEGTRSFKSAPEKTIYDLLQYAVETNREACDAVWHFRRELNTVHEYPILIAVDGVNLFHTPETEMGDPLDGYIFSPNIPPERLMLTRPFCEFKQHGLMNGLYVGATTHTRASRKYDMRKRYKNLHVVEVPPFNREEVHQICRYYKENGLDSNFNEQTVDYLWQMSSGFGPELWRQVLMNVEAQTVKGLL